ncbi:IclR family transcriptional regulator domain-containing protein [Sphingomonas corticis]|uniref:IclR family transcriptional regulator n=1 Tax=Sphingomonas corticis TaxID=2722791 RepID=A0ABX1CQ47_9SPHN|nr:IclR family transcriptional regulator [Sphingomonas corticis]
MLEEIADRQPIGVSELARALDLPKTTIHRSLQVLQKTGWIEAIEAGRPLWALSIKALSVGSLAVNSQGALRAVALPAMESLRRATGETVHLNLYHRDSTVLVERLDGLNPTRTFNALGGTVTLHPTASGRVRLSLMKEEELERYLAHPHRSPYELTPEKADELRRLLPMFRDRGYTETLGGLFEGVNAIAAPIFAGSRTLIGALSVSAPAERMDAEARAGFAGLLLDAARDISTGMRVRRAG